MDLAVVRAARSTGSVCAPCLGRLFADRSHGLTNAERGKALRVAEAMAADEPYEPPSPEGCWVCEGWCDRVDDLADDVITALADVDFATYLIGSRVPPLIEENESLLRTEVGMSTDAGEGLSREINREVGRRVGRRADAAVDFDRPDVQVTLDLGAEEIEVQVNSVMVYGRYRKVERDVPQTKWPCSDCDGTGRQGTGPCRTCDGTGMRYETSVEEEIGPPLRNALRGAAFTFHGAGREDVDALMVGTGRPFVMEVTEPLRRRVDLDAVATDVNASAVVEVEGLRFATHEMVERVKELDASKTYRIEVSIADRVSTEALQGALDGLEGTTISQRTPTRVDHRRADRVRERTVYDIDGEVTADGTAATLEIHGEGGLYVKELVTGDGGRTDPSLAGCLETEVRVETLDVLAVEGEEEPFEREAYFLD